MSSTRVREGVRARHPEGGRACACGPAALSPDRFPHRPRRVADMQAGSNPVWALRLYTLEVLQTPLSCGVCAFVSRHFVPSSGLYGRDRE